MKSRNDVNKITDVNNPYICYFLGFLWGDGYLQNTDKNPNRISIEILSNDFNVLLPIFESILKFSTTHRTRKNRQPQSSMIFSSKYFYQYLVSHGYENRSLSHYNICKNIPIKNIHYWIRGLFDADGCIYTNHDNHCYQFSICSEYEQDWSFINILLTENNINQKILRRTQGKNKHSVIRGTGKQNCFNLFKFLYPNQIYDFGLKRKFDKFIKLKDTSNLKQIHHNSVVS